MTEQGQGQSTSEGGVGQGVGQGQEQGQSEEQRTFTQADLNKIAANEKREGRNSILSELEVEDFDGLKEIVTTYRQAQDEAQSDLERYEQENKTLKEREKAALKLADDRLISVELKLALMDRGVPRERLNDALALTNRDGLAVGKDGSVTGLEDAVTATLEPRSWLTEAQQQEAPTPRRAPDVTRQPVGSASSTDPQQAHGQFLASLLSNNNSP